MMDNMAATFGGFMNTLIEDKKKVKGTFRFLMIGGLCLYASSLYNNLLAWNVISVIMTLLGILGYYEWEKICTENKDAAEILVTSMADGLSRPKELLNPFSDYKSLKRMNEERQEKIYSNK